MQKMPRCRNARREECSQENIGVWEETIVPRQAGGCHRKAGSHHATGRKFGASRLGSISVEGHGATYRRSHFAVFAKIRFRRTAGGPRLSVLLFPILWRLPSQPASTSK